MAFPENGAGGCLLPSCPFPLIFPIFLPHSLSNSFPPFPSTFPFPFPFPYLLSLSLSLPLYPFSFPIRFSFCFPFYLPLLPFPSSFLYRFSFHSPFLSFSHFPSSFLFRFSFPIPLSFPSPLSPLSKQVGRMLQYAVFKVPMRPTVHRTL